MKLYIKAAFDNQVPEWLAKDKRALAALNQKGFDLKKMRFSGNSSGRGKDYPIYLIDAGYRNPIVWIPGIYNDNEYITDPSDRNYKMLKYIAKKNLDIVDTVYINKTDYLKEAKKDRYQDPRNDEQGNYAGQYYIEPDRWNELEEGKWSEEGKRGRYGIRRDKSGYVIPNPDKMLLDFYSSDRGSQRLAKRVEKVYNELTELKERIFNIDFTSFGKDHEGNADYSSTTYSNVLGWFGNACRNYRLALNEIEKEKGEKWGGYHNAEAFREVRDIERSIERIKKALDTENDW